MSFRDSKRRPSILRKAKDDKPKDNPNPSIDTKASNNVPKPKKEKNASYKFQPGNTMGKGRPEGCKSLAQIALEKIGKDASEEVYAIAVAHALQGDTACMRMILDRVIPLQSIRKGAKFKIPLPKVIDTPKQLDEATNMILQLVCEGEISIEEGQGACDIIAVRAESIQINDIDARLAALENKGPNG